MRALWNREDLERAQHGLLRFTPEQATLIRSRATLLAQRNSQPPTPNFQVGRWSLVVWDLGFGISLSHTAPSDVP